MKHFTIAIDGPGGAGKSTVAKNVAAKLGVLHLDTGAMYRAFAWQALRDGLSTTDPEGLAKLAGSVKIGVTFENGAQHTFVNGQDVTALIRTPEISMATSDCATHSEVRRLMVSMQQQLAARQSMILDGRDIGTRVLPDATLKIYLTASSEVRAKRRFDELATRGVVCDYQTVLADVIARDTQDSTRAIDPLSIAEDAVVLDTSDLTQAQVEEAILDLLHTRLMRKGGGKADGRVREPFTFAYRMAMWLSTFLFNTLFPVRYHHAERADMDAPFILIGNHNSMIDPLLIGWQVRRYQIRYLGKKELTKSRLMKSLFKHLTMIPVDRHNMDMQAVRACLKTLKENHVLGIFPEGTRHKKTLMDEMESGIAMIALRGDVPILPAYITGKPKLFRPIDCYYGEAFSVAKFAEAGINREACDQVLKHIASLYHGMAQAHLDAK